ncbi:hypothetical protein [Hyphomicrobium sp.]|jgi:hypothetical protein|uniref:hypothetical protein n=1 Tax=Hyphomicrobium sp. TaxID=82 RepID=UPI0035681E8A
MAQRQNGLSLGLVTLFLCSLISALLQIFHLPLAVRNATAAVVRHVWHGVLFPLKCNDPDRTLALIGIKGDVLAEPVAFVTGFLTAVSMRCANAAMKPISGK